MHTTSIDPFLAFEHPELVVLHLLQHALAAAHQALSGPHPEIHTNGDLGTLEEECHLAILIAEQLGTLHDLLARYRVVIEIDVLDDDLLPTDDDPPY